MSFPNTTDCFNAQVFNMHRNSLKSVLFAVFGVIWWAKKSTNLAPQSTRDILVHLS